MKYIKLTKNKMAIIDDEDFDWKDHRENIRKQVEYREEVQKQNMIRKKYFPK